MGVIDGSPVNAANTNAAFLDANNDDTDLGKLNLNNISDATNSGTVINNVQRELNSISSFTGKATNIIKSAKPSWTNNDVGTTTDTLKDRSDALTQKFNSSIGHMHTGAPGDGPLLTSTSISGVPLQGFAIQGITLTGVTGTSTDVSTQLSGAIASAGTSSEGIVVTAPYNKIILRNSSGSEFVDGSGNLVYARLINSGITWTLNYYSLISGVETPYTFVSSSVDWYYQQLFNKLYDSPVYSDIFVTPSDNTTSDVLDASETQAGKVLLSNIVAQPVGTTNVKGISTRVSKEDHAHEGVHSLAIDGLGSPQFGDVLLESGIGINLSYDGPKIKIDSTGGATPNIGGTRSLPQNITAVGGITFSGSNYFNDYYIQGNGSPITVTSNPQISSGSLDGQRLTLIGRSAINTVTLQDGTGLSLNGSWIGGLDSILNLRWDTSNWVEVSRR